MHASFSSDFSERWLPPMSRRSPAQETLKPSCGKRPKANSFDDIEALLPFEQKSAYGKDA